MRICKFGGKEPGRGAERLLESRCSSTRDVRVEIEPVIVPEIVVEDRSLTERKVRGVNEGRVMGG